MDEMSRRRNYLSKGCERSLVSSYAEGLSNICLSSLHYMRISANGIKAFNVQMYSGRPNQKTNDDVL